MREREEERERERGGGGRNRECERSKWKNIKCLGKEWVNRGKERKVE